MSEFTKPLGKEVGGSGTDVSSLEGLPKTPEEYRASVEDKEEYEDAEMTKEEIVAELNHFLEEAKGKEDYNENTEYRVPVDLQRAIKPILAKLDKRLYDIDHDEINSKYLDAVDSLLRTDDIYEEDFDDDDEYSDARHEARISGVENRLGDEECISTYNSYADGFMYFEGYYKVFSGKENETRKLTYTRDILYEPKNVPMSMTTGLAEVLIEKLGEEKDK